MLISRSSFRARLIFGAIIWITTGLGVSWWVLAQLFRDHAMSEFADELDHHATELVNLLELDASGHVHLRVPLSDHRFMGFERGYYWQIERPDGDILRSTSLQNAHLKLSLGFGGPWSKRQSRMPGPNGEVLVLERVVALGDGTETARVAVAMDLLLAEDFLATFKRTLAIALGTIALGLIVAAFAQISIGLRPLGRVRQALLAVRRGEAKRLPENLPDEVLPLPTTSTPCLMSMTT